MDFEQCCVCFHVLIVNIWCSNVWDFEQGSDMMEEHTRAFTVGTDMDSSMGTSVAASSSSIPV
ncbi:hypothetical protein RchiOBHm_Chr5g0056991 [Rosa chinensis]|uniref:Uncharacterized protein n=1 Tax=Rosa chinensis TaxID=74649 RepID=A0A2P6QGT4_ROSCH|nr:hypothetical protein RchiOBHm_Chr5g0056991 [Rosa chinensis]